MFEVSADIAALLMIAAFLAGLVDAIAGGGGLITVPALLLAGVPPVTAIATNKLQGSFGAAAAFVVYRRAGLIRPGLMPGAVAVSALAAAAGTFGSHLVPAEALRLIIPVLLVGVALFFAFKPGLTDESRPARMQPLVLTMTVVPLVAAYDGFLGPGTGSFFMLGLVVLAGLGIMQATAQAKLLNLASNLGALAVFVWFGSVWWGIGLAMAAAQVAGATLGSRFAVLKGARLIKPLLVTVSLALAARLIFQAVWEG